MKQGFLNDTVADIISKHGWSNMDDLTLVFPSRRAGVVVKDLLKQYQTDHKTQAILLPNITTLPELFESLCPYSTIEELEAIFRLYKIYESETRAFYTEEKAKYEKENIGKKYDDVKPFNLDVFYSWGRQLLSDFNNIDSSDAGKTPESVHAFFDNTIQAKELEKLDIDDEVRERLVTLLHEGETTIPEDTIRRKYEAIWKCMENIYNNFHEDLRNVNRITTGMQKRWVIDHWEEIKSQCANQQFAFIGFNYLLPVEKELFAKIQLEQSDTLFYWDYVENFQTNTKAYSFIEKNMKLCPLPENLKPSIWTQKHVNAIAASSANAQAQYVHQWLKDNYKEKGQCTAVVICDEQMLEPVIYALPAIKLDNDPADVNINITKGFPISSTKIYSDVIAYLTDKNNDCKEGETYTDVVRRVLDEVVNTTDKNYLDYVDSQNITLGKQAKDTWQTLLIEESIYQVQLQLNQLYIVLSNPAYKGLINSLTLLRSIVRRCMENVSLPFHGEPITDIQVMGVLETRALDFDNILLLNVEEGVVPRKENDSSFIPYYLRKSFHMQTREEAASVYAYNFFRLLHRATNITMVFSNAQTQMGAKSMSRFLMQIMTSPNEFTVSRYVLRENATLPESIAVHPSKTMLDRLEIGKDGYFCYKDGEKAGRKYPFSPSALNTYIQCPRQFYLRYIEGLRDKNEPHAIFESNEIGTFVHAMMEDIYKNVFQCKNNIDKPITIDANELEKLESDENKLKQILKKAYDKQNQDYKKNNPDFQGNEFYEYDKHQAENLVIMKLVHKILKHDIEDVRTKGLQIVALEQKEYYDIDIKDKNNSYGKIQIGGIIDRLDICGGTMRIVDYKTGGYNAKKLDVSFKENEKGIALVTDPGQHYVLQTLIYSEAMAQKTASSVPLQPNLFFTQSNLNNTAVTINNEVITDYRALRNDTDDHKGIPTIIKEKIQEIFTTDEFPQCDEGKCTSYCPFLDICGRESGFIPNN